MRSGVGLNLEQSQKLIMTPELRQAVVILQLSTLELAEYIQQELQENPILELKDEEPSYAEDLSEEMEKNDIDWREYFSDGSDLGYLPVQKEDRERELTYENFLAGASSLHDYLLLQLKLAISNSYQYRIGEFLIGNIDDNGYLRISLNEAAAHLQVPVSRVREVLEIIQRFDPPGVGACDLTQCLLLQLRQRENVPYGVEDIIRYHLKDVAAGRFSKIARRLQMTLSEVQAAVDFIRTLDPKPGRTYGHAHDVRYIIPDVIIERVGDEYVVLVNDVGAPRLGINPTYQALLRQEASCDPSTRKFIEGKLNAAAWIIRSIEQRRLTLYRVVNCIVKEQREFLEKGCKYLKPLTMRKVAEALGLHESTVSRATANKYVQTPQGIFELKFFFANGITKGEGAAATESIKKALAEAIAKEDSKRPLTDQELAEILNKNGFCISRRTVAKYRGDLGIPPAVKRRRY
ncbi:MAG: polymerase sigma-54 factor [Clostridia bacterium]|nr:polymerase sigma-54 factor [Clostridia bacterium]